MYLDIIHIHPQTFIGSSDIADCRLLQDRIRKVSHLLFHLFHKRVSLLRRHHPHDIEYRHIIRYPLLREIFL